MAKKEADVSTPSWAFGAMENRWVLIETLLGGTVSMRAAGESLLPKYENESSTHWQERIDRTVLTNMLEMTSDHLVGQALKVPPQADEDVPENIGEMLEDVDGQGTGLATFGRNIFKEAIDKAFTHVLIDFPAVSDLGVDGQPRTLADDREDGLRPYWVHIKPEELFFAHSTVIQGKEVLTHIRFFQTVVEVVGWEEIHRHQIRVLRRELPEITDENPEGGGDPFVSFEVWELQKVRNKKEEWVMIDFGTMDIDEIPLVTFYTVRDGFMVGKPPLTDLAHLNVAHWQSSSDQRNVLTVARFPILAASGTLGEDEEGKITVGPHSFLFMPDPQGKFYYVEHSGDAIEAGRNDLKDLEEQMANFGAEFMKQRPGNEGTTARLLETSESLSSLQVWVIDFKDALENCLRLTAKWMGASEDDAAEGGSILLDSDDIGISEADTSHLDALDKARTRKDISRKAYLEELKRRQVLSEAFDIDDDHDELEDEAPDPSDGMSGMFGPDGQPLPAPGQQPPPGGPPDDDDEE